MHDAAREWVEVNWVPARHVVDVGGRNVNYGTVRYLWHDAETYVAIDLHEGEGVDWVGDFLDYESDVLIDLVICMEVAEHCEYWEQLLAKAADILQPGGVLLFTAAGPDRLPHSGIDGGPLRQGEWYNNIKPGFLSHILAERFSDVQVTVGGGDRRALVYRPYKVPIIGPMGDVYAKAIK